MLPRSSREGSVCKHLRQAMLEVVVKAEEEHLPGFIPARHKRIISPISMHAGGMGLLPTSKPAVIDCTRKENNFHTAIDYERYLVAHLSARCSVGPTGPLLANHLPCRTEIVLNEIL